ncbi:MAG: HAD family hydrolase [Terracidiphilus sp.]|jgi:D-glycero-D-manno-heptose 1,7-bisphosphate phosphatase
MSKRAAFLDRDGVINSYVYNQEFGTVDSPNNPEEFLLLPGVRNAIVRFRNLGFLVVVVSNQPGIAKRKFSQEILDATTEKMHRLCDGCIDAVYYCLHHPHAADKRYECDCDCRKPRPGLLLEAAAEWNIDLAASVMIGDGLTDVMAGQRAGTRTILVGARKCYVCAAMDEHRVTPDFCATTLSEAVGIVESLEMTVSQGSLQV